MIRNHAFTAVLLATSLLTPAALAHPGADHEHNSKPNLVQNQRVLLGWGDHAFESVPGWSAIPNTEHLGSTHGGVAVDSQGLVYVSLDSGTHGLAVYQPDGTFVKKIAEGIIGLHSLLYREEDGTGYLYAAHVSGPRAVKLTLDGDLVWEIGRPEESGKYPGNANYRPTSVAVGPDGDVYIADGYGQNWVHQYDKDQTYIRSFGGRGRAPGQFTTCHGIALDTRGDEPRLLVCDRENRRLQYFDLEGNFLSVSTTGLYRPCAVSFYGEFVAIAELAGRVVILDGDDDIVSVLGDNPNDGFRANFNVEPKDWTEGIFNAPHGLCYDHDGNLIVEEWNKWGRVTFLKKIDATDAPSPPAGDAFSADPETYGQWLSSDAAVTTSSTSQWDPIEQRSALVNTAMPQYAPAYAFHTGQEDKPCVTLDLGQSRRVKAVSVWNRAGNVDRAGRLALLTSTDGQTWAQQWQADEPAGTWEIELDEPVTARYIRLEARPAQGQTYLHLRHIRVYGE